MLDMVFYSYIMDIDLKEGLLYFILIIVFWIVCMEII